MSEYENIRPEKGNSVYTNGGQNSHLEGTTLERSVAKL